MSSKKAFDRFANMSMDEMANVPGTGPAPDARGHANIPSAADAAVEREIRHPRNPGMHGGKFESHGLN